jgi:PAS domain S-box-containing protein
MVPPDPHTARLLTHDESNPRLAKVAGLETVFLIARYVLVAIYAGVYFRGAAPFDGVGMLILGAAFLLHNIAVHIISYYRLYRLYLQGVNLLAHTLQCTILVMLTGAENSPFALIYVFILLAQVVYAPHFRRIQSVLAVCATAFVLAVFARAMVYGEWPSWLRVGATLVGMVFCFGLIRSLANLLYTIELGLQTRAQELASSKSTLRTILDSAGGAIIVYDDNEFITEANARACEFFNCPREELLGLRFRQFFFDDGTLPGKLATLNSKGEYQGELLAVLSDGEESNVSVSVRSFIQEGRRSFVALLHDITEQKHLQETTRKANVRLEQVNRELQQVDALRNAFFGAVSQRLRSPLSAILGYTNLLIDEELGGLNAEQRKALQSCRRSVDRVFGLVDEAFVDHGGNNGDFTDVESTSSDSGTEVHEAEDSPDRVGETPQINR